MWLRSPSIYIGFPSVSPHPLWIHSPQTYLIPASNQMLFGSPYLPHLIIWYRTVSEAFVMTLILHPSGTNRKINIWGPKRPIQLGVMEKINSLTKFRIQKTVCCYVSFFPISLPIIPWTTEYSWVQLLRMATVPIRWNFPPNISKKNSILLVTHVFLLPNDPWFLFSPIGQWLGENQYNLSAMILNSVRFY